MKHQTHRYRAERKAGLHKAPKAPDKLFASEIVLANAPLSVQELLQSAMTKRMASRFAGVQKQQYHKLPGGERIPFRVVWPSSRFGTFRRPERVDGYKWSS